jgi:NADH:ubiquinone oxidoreductase subunit 5 (subunit L)/multisubunit Na+/H+ antiporter MnhA subunit
MLLTIAALPLLAALASATASRGDAERRAAFGTGAVGVAFALSLAAFGLVLAGQSTDGFLLGIDRLRGLMLILVTGIATIVHAFATRYMNSDPGYARFFAWLGAVTAAVIGVVLASNLAVLAVAWCGVSVALYQLQIHYRDRPVALAAARPMRAAFAIGDLAMVGACAGLVWTNHTGSIAATLAGANAMSTPLLYVVVGLFAIAAFSKSSQIPLHRWLPDTMEAPTPVSALMHAGIVNAGGFLLVRFSPLVVDARGLAVVIFLAGAATAFWGSSCMLVRPDVKRGLAYSTVGQMGYMIMQCGLGAFPAAILHLFAHGIFKATLFLGSGYAVHDFKRELRAPVEAKNAVRHPRAGAAAGMLVVAAGVAVALSPLGRALPPYGWVLLSFATLTCMQAVYAIVRRGTAAEIAAAAALVIVVLPGYAALVGAFDRFLAADVAAPALLVSPILAGAVVALFALGLVLSWGIVALPAALRDRAYVWLLSEGIPFRVRAKRNA